MKKWQIAALISTIVVLSACIRKPAPVEPPTGSDLATPVAESPAAGICAEQEGDVVSVTINPDIPDPRCSIVRSDQFLRIVNMRGETIAVSLAGLSADIQPGGEHTFDQPFGSLLMPGVHRFAVSPCCGAELILRTDS